MAKLTLKDECRIDKRDERLAPAKAWVDEQYNNGRDTVIGDDELVAVIKEKAAGLWEALNGEKSA